MGLAIRLLLEVPKWARAFLDFSMACWIWMQIFSGTTATEQQEVVQQPPQLNAEQEAAIAGAYQHMATLFENYRLGEKLQAPPSF